MFERMEIAESIYKGVVEPFYKNLPGHTRTVLVIASIREETPQLHGPALRRVISLESEENEI